MSNESLKKTICRRTEKDLFSAENQLVKALPKMPKLRLRRTSSRLRKAFGTDQRPRQRLDEIFQLSTKARRARSVGWKGLVKEGSEVMAEDFDDAVLDAGLIGAADAWNTTRWLHTERSAEFAHVLGQTRHASLLEKTLAEEKQTDDKLAELAKEIKTPTTRDVEEEQGAPRSARKTPKRAA